MMGPAVSGGHVPPNIWLKIGAFNLAVAIVAGAFLGLGARAIALAAADWKTDRRAAMLRAVKGDTFFLLGALYTLFAWPMLVWDRPARLFAVFTILLPPVVAVYRRSRGGSPSAPKSTARILSAFLIFVLFLAAALTLLRAGFITLAGDRVPLVVEITGETRVQETSARWIPKAQGTWTEHRVILWLPDGTPAADLWVPYSRLAFTGRAVVFSHRLNALGFPNLYQFLAVHAGPGENPSREVALALPHVGPLAVHPLWHPLQELILRAWPRSTADTQPFWAARVFENESPDYPLTGPDGAPLRARFLLDLTLEGVPTSRGSSPFEKQ